MHTRRMGILIAFVLLITGASATVWMLSAEQRAAGLLFHTALLAVGTAVVALPLGAVLALLIVKTDIPGRRAAALVLVALLFVPLYLLAAGWDAGFGLQGWYTFSRASQAAAESVEGLAPPVEPLLAGWRAAVWVHAMAAIPWVALIIGAGVWSVEPELEEDANLHANGARVLLRVTMRRAAASLVMACLWIAMQCSAEIAITDLFQVRTFAEEVYTQARLGAFDFAPEEASGQDSPPVDESSSSQISTGDGDWALPASGLWCGVLISALLGVLALSVGRRWIVNWSKVRRPTRWIWRLRRRRTLAGLMAWTCLLFVVGVPLGNLMYKAGVRVTTTEQGRQRSWSAAKVVRRLAAAPREHQGELLQTAMIGASAATAAVLVAVPLAWSMRFGRSTPWIRLTLMVFFLVLPGPLLGIGIIRLLNQPLDSVLAWMTWMYDEHVFGFAPWLAQTVRALPVATIVLWPTLASVPSVQLESAACEGAGRWRQLASIALPQRLPALAAAWMIALAVAVGEVSATSLVAPPGVTTLSMQILQSLHYGVEDRVASISLVMVFGVASLTWAALAILRRSSRDF